VRILSKLFLTAATLLFAVTAEAYVGPGAGISVLGALWGLIIGVVMAVGVILFWPIRMLIRKLKANKATQAEQGTTDTPDATAESAEAASTHSENS
jgi:hypothetical protein